MGQPYHFQMAISKDSTPKGCLAAEVLSNKTVTNHWESSELSVMDEMRKLSCSSPYRPEEFSIANFFSVVEVFHDRFIGERRSWAVLLDVLYHFLR